MRRAAWILALAACGGAHAKTVEAPKPDADAEGEACEPGVIVYQDGGEPGKQRWVDLRSSEHGTLPLAVAAVAGEQPGFAWITGYNERRPDVMVLIRLARTDKGVVGEVGDARPAPQWGGKSIVNRTLTGARAVAPDGKRELLVCPDDVTLVCIRSLIDAKAERVVGKYAFANPSYAVWTAGGPVVFDASEGEVTVVSIDPDLGTAVDGGHIATWSIPTVSPDGRTLAWFQDGALHTRPLAEPAHDITAIPMPDAAILGDCRFLDDEHVVCGTGQEARSYLLWSIDLGAGTAHLLADDLGQPMWAASPDRSELAYARMTATVEDGGLPRLAIMPAAGGESRWVDPPGDTLQFPVVWLHSAACVAPSSPSP
jgi:hypothetical protein